MDTNEPTAAAAGGWGILEIVGHQAIAGFISEETLFGMPRIRVDVPSPDGTIKTKRWAASALFSLEWTTKARALEWLRRQAWQRAEVLGLPEPRTVDEIGASDLVEEIVEHLLDDGSDDDEDDELGPSPVCRVCGCTEDSPCSIDGQPCYWVEDDLCSTCAGGRT